MIFAASATEGLYKVEWPGSRASDAGSPGRSRKETAREEIKPGQLTGPPNRTAGRSCFKNCSALKPTRFPFLLHLLAKGIILRRGQKLACISSRFGNRIIDKFVGLVTISDTIGLIYDFLLIWHACCSCFEKRSQPCKLKLERKRKSILLSARSTTFSLLVVDDEVTTRNLCRDVAADAGLQVLRSGRPPRRRWKFWTSIRSTSWSRICRFRNWAAWNC